MTVTDVTQAAEPEKPVLAATIRRRAVAHWRFGAVLAVAAVLRIVVMLGYPPAMYFNDSWNYLTDAAFRSADIVRPDGYPLFIFLLEPFHSVALVTALQALMGLAIGTGIYAVLRRRGLPWWGATLAALPVLFDNFELQLEHMVAADTLFTFCVMAVLILLTWFDTLPPSSHAPCIVTAVSGLILGYAALVRSEGEALIVVLLIALIARSVAGRGGGRGKKLLAAAIAFAVPVAAYMLWFHSQHGQYALTRSSGTFLYSRVQSFAECDKMNPPANLRVLCDPRAPKARPSSQEYLWSNQTPLAALTGTNNVNRFTPHIEQLTRSYAELAIEKQPLDYARVVTKDILRTFEWTRAESNLEGSGSKFRFENTPTPVPSWVTTSAVNRTAAERYGGPSLGATRVVKPWSTLLQIYQKVFYVRGPLLFLILLLGFAGVIAGWRVKRAGETGGLLPWLTAVALIVLPPMTAGFSYRYAIAAVPPACLAAALAFERPGITAWLRSHGMVPAHGAPPAPATPPPAPATPPPAPGAPPHRS
jgi:hypothetical protein